MGSEDQVADERQQSIFKNNGIVPGAIYLYQSGRVEVVEVQGEVNVVVTPLEEIERGRKRVVPRHHLSPVVGARERIDEF